MTMPMKIHSGAALPSRTQHGFGLIELMVGLTLGLLVTLVITQVWGSFEGQKQRTVSVSSAQVAGLLALTELEQDLRNAGAGLSDPAIFACSNIFSYYSGTAVISPIPAYSGNLFPVQITRQASGSDSLAIKRTGDPLGAIPTLLTQAQASAADDLSVAFTTGFSNSDIVLVADATSGNCTVMSTNVVQANAFKFTHDTGSSYNPPATYLTANSWPIFPSGAKVMKLGPLVSRVYSLDATNQLVVADQTNPTTTTNTPVGTDIVALRAQYGIANAGSQDVSAWVDATSTSGWNTLDTTKVKQIKAVRIAVVARSSKFETADVTPPCKDSTGVVVNPNGPCVWSDSEPVVNLSANTSWKRYRYRIYQTIIPLRNVIWAGV